MRRGRENAIGSTWVASALLVVGLLVLVPGSGHAENSQPEESRAYDPFGGMDPNGRIPKIDKAKHVSNPERWRYLPESRIPPGDVFDRFLVSSIVFPIVFYNSDVGAGFGAGIADNDFRKQRRREFLGAFGSYSTEGQQSYSLGWRRVLKQVELPNGGVLQEERSFVRLSGGYRKTLTRRFYGIGPATNERDESSFTDEMFFVEGGLAQSLEGAFEDFIVSFAIRGEHHRLSGGEVGGAPDTDAVAAFLPLFNDADRTSLGWLNAGLAWDTRDSVRNPYRGAAIGGTVQAALLQADRTVGAIYSIFADKVWAMPPLFHNGGDAGEEHPPTDSIGIHFRTQLTSGDLPFYVRPTLGGSNIQRGYIAGRWRDDALWAAAAEYRFWVIPRGFTVWKNIRVERIGGAIFYEAGGIGADAGSLFDSGVLHSYGFGGRATIERAVLFRLDLGFSDEGMNLAAGFGLSF